MKDTPNTAAQDELARHMTCLVNYIKDVSENIFNYIDEDSLPIETSACHVYESLNKLKQLDAHEYNKQTNNKLYPLFTEANLGVVEINKQLNGIKSFYTTKNDIKNIQLISEFKKDIQVIEDYIKKGINQYAPLVELEGSTMDHFAAEKLDKVDTNNWEIVDKHSCREEYDGAIGGYINIGFKGDDTNLGLTTQENHTVTSEPEYQYTMMGGTYDSDCEFEMIEIN